MAKGHPAFAGATTALTHEAVLNADTPLPSRLNPALPAGFDAIISKALEKDLSCAARPRQSYGPT